MTEIRTTVKDRQNPENDYTTTTKKTYDNGNVTTVMVTKDKTGESITGPFKEKDYTTKDSNPLEVEYKRAKPRRQGRARQPKMI
jgi:hypothetical protein